MSVWIVFSALSLAAIIGFAAHRASLCSVRAVEEVLTTRRAFMLLGFAKSSLWVIGVTLLVTLFLPVELMGMLSWELTLYTIVGGLIFGIGATVNGGCAFSTLTRLGSGNMGMLVSLTGVLVGAGAYSYANMLKLVPLPNSSTTPFSQIGDWRASIAFILLIWMVWELYKLFRPPEKVGIVKRSLSPQYRLSTAAVLMGISNAFLYGVIGVWPYTGALGQSARFIVNGTPPPALILWVLFAALIFGVLISAWQSHRLRWQGRPQFRWIGYFCGGSLMGIGASMIPGGNDMLILQGIPSLSIHAVPALLAILVGIAASLSVMRVMGRTIPKTDCSGDICWIDREKSE